MRLDGLENVILAQGEPVVVLGEILGAEQELAEPLAHIVGRGGELIGCLANVTLLLRVRGDVGLKHTKTAHCDS